MRREIIYMGWLGHNNFGDDLLYETWRRALGDSLPNVAPLRPRDYVRNLGSFLVQRIRSAGAEKILLLGGGTALGFETWADHVITANAMYNTSASVLVGTGAAAQTDEFAVGLQKVNWLAWKRIEPLLVSGVRGPITQEEVHRGMGIKHRIVGDPALMYPSVGGLNRDLISQGQETIGICVGSHTSTRYDLPAVAEAVKHVARNLGLRPEVFQLSDSDADVAARMQELLGKVEVVKYAGDVSGLMKRIASTRVFVSERLHGAVAAISMDTPTVPLSYGSKCDDFWTSISGNLPTLTPSSSANELAVEIEARAEKGFEAKTRERRDALVASLLDTASHIKMWRAGETSTSALAAYHADTVN